MYLKIYWTCQVSSAACRATQMTCQLCFLHYVFFPNCATEGSCTWAWIDLQGKELEDLKLDHNKLWSDQFFRKAMNFSSMLASIKDSEEEVCRLELCSVLYEQLRVQMYFNVKKVNMVVGISWHKETKKNQKKPNPKLKEKKNNRKQTQRGPSTAVLQAQC